MVLPSAEENIKTVMEWLTQDEVGIIKIKGEPNGVGKTWTAKQVMDRAIAASDYELVLWVDVVRGSTDEFVLLQNADQLEMLSPKQREETSESELRKKIQLEMLSPKEIEEINESELRNKVYKSLENKRFLLIIDLQIPITYVTLSDFGVPNLKKQNKSSKVVCVGNDFPMIRGIDRVLEIRKLPSEGDEAWVLFRQKAALEVNGDSPQHIRDLVKPLLNYCDGLPIAILRVAAAFRKFNSSWTLEARLTSLMNDHLLGGERDWGVFLYDMLPNTVMKDCFLYCTLYSDGFFGAISKKQLITRWILQGLLDIPFTNLEKAYDKGLYILKELIDRYLLFQLDDNNVTMDIQLTAHRMEYLNEFYERVITKALLRLTQWNHLHEDPATPKCCSESIREIYMISGNLQSIHSDASKFPKSSALLLHGDRGRLHCEFPDAFFEKMQHLQLLAILNAEMPSSLPILENLHVLVLKCYVPLELLQHIQRLQNLLVLSLSGASTLKNLPDDFFEHMNNLQTLDLSNTQLHCLPSSFSKLWNIHHLILRGCSYLEEVTYYPPSLLVLDLSGASALRTFFFSEHDNLLILDLSETLVDRLPDTIALSKIKYLLLRGCSRISTLPCPEALQNVCVLDLSGASAFRGFQDTPPANSPSSLQIIDLSETPILKLPCLSKCPSLRKLFLRNCSNLQRLPSVDSGVEVLDLSYCTAFREFENQSFGKGLQSLDLSDTQVVNLPAFSECSSLCQLILRSCLNLEVIKDDAFENLHKLQILNLSATQLKKLPDLSKCSSLRSLLLRDCTNLKKLSHMEVLEGLEVLDLSGATALEQLEIDYSEKQCALKILNLSRTSVVHLPSLSRCTNLRKILLKGCSQLKTLPGLEALTRLRLLDLSCATSLMDLPDEAFGQMYNLRSLNISATQIETLPHLKALGRLEVLDLSGVTAFRQFKDKSFEHMCNLRILDLSETQITELPLLSGCINLCQLLLRRCPNLATLPHLKSLRRLKELDLSCSPAFRQFRDEHLENYELQKLDLSKTQVEQLPSLSKCSHLGVLILRDCSMLKMLPGLEALTRLQVLDLSGATSFTEFQDEAFIKNNSLQILNLSGTKRCSNLKNLSFECMHHLQKLDLSGTPIKQLPPSLSEVKNLSHLILNDCSNLETIPHLEVLTRLEVLELSCTKFSESRSSISKLKYLRFLGTPSRKYFWGSNYENQMEIIKQLENSQRFQICLCTLEERPKEEEIHLHDKECDFSYIYYQTSQLPESMLPDKFFKICGFQGFPIGIEEVLSHVEILYLKKNSFITRLSDLGANNVNVMKECWIERCDRMSSLFHEEDEEENVVFGRSLQNLWVSNLSEARTLYEGAVQPKSFTCMKHMYIDCCPSLMTIFSSRMGLENLETLRIKFCDKFDSVFGEMVLGEDALPRLHTLTLWKLPTLQKICEGVLPSLQKLRVKGCSNLKRLPLNSTTLRVQVIGEHQWWDKLKWEDEGTASHLCFTPLRRYL